MKIRAPLYAQWAIGLVLHVTLFAAAAAALLGVRFREPVSRLVLQGSRDRIEAAVRLLVSELEALPPYEWDGPVHRFERHYNVRLALVAPGGEPLVGSLVDLPEDIAERLRRGPFAFGGPPRGARPPEPDAEPAPPVATAAPAEPARRMMIWMERAGDPPSYWLMTRVRIELAGEPLRATLVIQARSLFGGLLANPQPLVLAALGLVLLSMLLWLPFVRGITRAVETLTRAGRRIAEGRFDTRVPVRRPDELGELSRTMNEMAARLDALVGDQKRFLGGIAHELCAPLARLQVALGILEQRAPAADRPYVESALAKAKEISDLVGELMSFSKAAFGRAAPACRAVDATALARAVVEREAAGRGVRVELPPGFSVRADPALLDRALGNVVRNAVRYAGDGPIAVRGAREGDDAVLSVEDEGPGVPPEALPRLFEPFFRVESSRDRDAGGQGLGLTLVKAAVESMGGSVSAELRAPRGLAVRLRLPAAPTTPEPGE